jgi:hypothetical protein
MRIYLTNNTNKSEPISILELDYIHVKSKCDGSQTVIICSDNIINPDISELTFNEAQNLLNNWIDQENSPPLPIDDDGKEIIQSYINLGVYFA